VEYRIDYGAWGGIFAVPNRVCDRYIKLCSEMQLKVLLLALRSAPEPIDTQNIGKRLGLTCEEVSDCLLYWQLAGLITPCGALPTELKFAVPASDVGASPSASDSSPKPSAPAKNAVREEEAYEGQKIVTVRHRSKLSPAQINEMSRKDKNIPILLEELQERLGKTLSPPETEAVVYIYSFFSLSVEYILVAAEYAKKCGKPNIRYIERMISSWVDEGIDTHDKAEEHILTLDRRRSNEGLIKSLFGISDRELSRKEKDYIDRWFTHFGMDSELIRLAYDKTVDSTGKLSFPYMDKILSQWNQKGICDLGAARAEMESGSPRRVSKVPSPARENTSYDLGDIQRLMELNSKG